MKNIIKFIVIAILISISIFAVNAQEQTIVTATDDSSTTAKVEKKEAPKKQSSDDDSWKGFYVGGYVGNTNGKANPRTSTIVTTVFSGPNAGIYDSRIDVDDIDKVGNQKISSNNFNGGAVFGYNYQKGKFVFGGEVDFGANRINKSVTDTRAPFPTRTYTVTQTVKSDWTMTARPRAGVALKKTLLYFTGGLAVTNVKYTGTFAGSVASVAESGNFGKTKAGWTAGAGAEVKVAKHLSVKGEYLFSQFGRTTITSTNATSRIGGIQSAAPGQVFTHSTDLKSHSFRFGINYRF
jgi:outer membrane immunogenic protein